MRRFLTPAVLAIMLAACATQRPDLDDLPADTVELTATPFHPQEEYQCGPAALATVLQTAGIDTDPDALVEQVWLPGRRGSLQLELVATTRRHDRVPYVIVPTLTALIAELEHGRPVLVMQNLGINRLPVWHFAVVIGWDPEREEIILRSGTSERVTMNVRRFLRSWERAESWGMVVLEPGMLPAYADRRRFLSALSDLERTGRPAVAVAGYRAWLEVADDDALALFGKANALVALGDQRGAEAGYQRLLELHPGDAAALNNLAQLFLARGCSSTALATLDRVSDAELTPRLRAALDATRAEAKGMDDRCRPSDGDEDVGDPHQLEYQ